MEPPANKPHLWALSLMSPRLLLLFHHRIVSLCIMSHTHFPLLLCSCCLLSPIWTGSGGLKTSSISASFAEARNGTGSAVCLHAPVSDRCFVKPLPIMV